MAAANTDYFTEVGSPGTATTLAAPGHSIGGTTFNVASTSNWPTSTGVIFATDTVSLVNGEEVRDVGSYREWEGVVQDATTIANATIRLGADRDYSAGSTTRVYIPVAASRENRLVQGLLIEHDQDGTHDATLIAKLAGNQTFTGTKTFGSGLLDTTAPVIRDYLGWMPTTQTVSVSSGYNKGNREFELTFSATMASIVSPGMRLKVTRGTTAPTQCADLESSSTQYATKSSPSGITFTDDFTVEVWVKPESFTAAMTILSRYDGSTGWTLQLDASTGQARIAGIGTAGAQDIGVTTTSVPIGVWTHIAASLDMSGTSAVIYFNGVSQPITYTNGAASALVQAGTLQLGAVNGTSQPFDGKLSDVRLWSAVRTATQIRDNMNQQLVGNESGLVSYYKLNGDLNDSTSNANNLTAQNSAAATNVDNPFNDTEYAIVTKVSTTTVTVFTGRNYHIPNMTLNSPNISLARAPFGFPGHPQIWSVDLLQHRETTLGIQNTPSDNTWYNMGSLSFQLPIGAWQLSHVLPIFTNKNGTVAQAWASLSTANNSESDEGNTNYADIITGTNAGEQLKRAHYHRNDVVVTADTTMYVIGKTANSQSLIKWASGDVVLRVWAVCGYL